MARPLASVVAVPTFVPLRANVMSLPEGFAPVAESVALRLSVPPYVALWLSTERLARAFAVAPGQKPLSGANEPPLDAPVTLCPAVPSTCKEPAALVPPPPATTDCVVCGPDWARADTIGSDRRSKAMIEWRRDIT